MCGRGEAAAELHFGHTHCAPAAYTILGGGSACHAHCAPAVCSAVLRCCSVHCRASFEFKQAFFYCVAPSLDYAGSVNTTTTSVAFYVCLCSE